MIYSKVYRVLLRPNLILGIPRSWFFISAPAYLIPFNLDHTMLGVFLYILSLFIGYLLAKYFDPDFADIILEFMKTIKTPSLKTKILTDSIDY